MLFFDFILYASIGIIVWIIWIVTKNHITMKKLDKFNSWANVLDNRQKQVRSLEEEMIDLRRITINTFQYKKRQHIINEEIKYLMKGYNGGL